MKSVEGGVMILVIPLARLSAKDPLEACKTKACENIARYVQAVRKIAGEFEASERAQRLLALKRRHADKMRHAPENARIAAWPWIAALS